MVNNQLDLSAQVQAAIDEITVYPAVQQVIDVVRGSHNIVVEVDWAVKLPNPFLRSGITETGIKAIEQVRWCIPLDFPSKAPYPQLRVDFPTSLPHINPHTVGDFVYPCVSEQPLEDLLHSMGFRTLLDAMQQWLEHAASDDLHCPVQGWELMRRDETSGIVHVDTHAIRRELDNSDQCCRFYSYRYRYFDDSKELAIGGLITPCLGVSNSAYKKKYVGIEEYSLIRNAPGLLLRTEEGKVFDEYRAETITDLQGLRVFARYLGLQEAFDARLKYILSISSPKSIRTCGKAPVEEFLVCFAVKRPFHIIGSDSPWELLPYRISYDLEGLEPLSDDTVVRPAQFIERCCPQLLQTVSGQTIEQPVQVALLGCGSLGSKVGLHLAKTGCYQFELVDKDYFSSHNNARHGLVMSDLDTLCYSKAHLLARQITGLNIQAEAIAKDIRTMGEKSGYSLRQETGYVIDTTASGSVRYYLAHSSPVIPGRLIHAVLYGKSTLGVVAIEGNDRSVRIDDMLAYLNALCIDYQHIQNAMYGNFGPRLNHYGEGCGSVTTTMSDIDISIMSAAMASRINSHVSKDLEAANGILHVGGIEPDTLDMSWVTYSLSPTVVLTSGISKWSVRVLGAVAERITELSRIDDQKECGGILAGQVCQLSKTIYVNYLLDAPEGSIGTPSEFSMSTAGLTEAFDEIHQKTNGQITFLGTWHSHTSPVPSSSKDKDSLKKLQANYDLPIVMLVYTGGHLVLIEC